MCAIQRQPAKIEWQDAHLPVSCRFDDPYYSDAGGLEETRHVFLSGNDLPERFTPGFHIAELGFGTGLNMLSAWQAWLKSGQKTPLRFTSFEAFPLEVDDMARALAGFPEVADLAAVFLEAWGRGETQMSLAGLEVNIILGDARQTIENLETPADAWFLDGFSPSKNPELWGGDLLSSVAANTKSGGTFATYTAAGYIRKTLADVGFKVERVSGFGRKRHMTIGKLDAEG